MFAFIPATQLSQNQNAINRGRGPGGEGCHDGASFLMLSAALWVGPHRSILGVGHPSHPLPQQSVSSGTGSSFVTVGGSSATSEAGREGSSRIS